MVTVKISKAFRFFLFKLFLICFCPFGLLSAGMAREEPVWYLDGPCTFNGISDYLETPVIGISGNSPWTIAAFITPGSNPGDEYGKGIIGWGYPAHNQGNFIYYNSDEQNFEYGFYGNDGQTGGYYPQDVPYHIAVTYDSNMRRVYVNGYEVASRVPGILNIGNTAAQIGRDPFGQNRYFKGSMEDIRIYDRALSSTEISDLAGVEMPDGNNLEPVYFNHFNVQGFWRTQYKRQITKWLIHCVNTLDTQAQGIPQFIEARKALDGLPHAGKTGYVFSDAYVYNTLESMCLALTIDPNGDQEIIDAQNYIETKLNEWIPLILAVQQADGYIDTLVLNTIDNGYVRYSNRGNHEGYVQAYFIEASVAHYKAFNGQDLTLYNAAKKCGDHFYNTFLKAGWPYSCGHEVIELALCRLGRLVNEVEGDGAGDKYIDTAKWLLDARGGGSTYDQNHLPVTEQSEAVGHAVRAVYLYTGMTDIAMLKNDLNYKHAVDQLWDSAVNRKMYLTGGVGASAAGEAFGSDYDLPNSGYCETCASCGFIFWNNRLNWYYKDARYADVVERAIYNNVLSSVDLAGENYYYQQPLDQSNARYSWHGCPCCVGNIPRTLLSLKDRAYALDKSNNTLYVNFYVAGSGTINNFAGTQVDVEQVTDYPKTGHIDLYVSPKIPTEFSIKVRIPDRAESDLYAATPEINYYNSINVNGLSYTPAIEHGYVTITRTWNPGDKISIELPMDIQIIKSDSRVAANVDRAAFQRGPLVYNIESVDQVNPILDTVYIDSDVNDFTAQWNTTLLEEPIMTIQGPAKFNDEQFELLAIPNYVRLNRGGRTIVWISNIKIVIPEPGTDLIWSGGPYTLDGIDDYISLPVDILTNCSDFTIATWVKLDTRRQWARIFDIGTDTTTNMFLTEEASTGNIRFAVTIGGSGAEEQINGSSPVATGSWQHVAVTLSQTEGKLYVNCSLMGSNTIHISPYLLGHTNHNYIGKSQYNDPYLDGQIDDFRIYNYALSSDDIKALAELRSYAE